jgi:peptide/nickel transport system substrate-binding protein
MIGDAFLGGWEGPQSTTHLRHQARLPECPVRSARWAPLDDLDGLVMLDPVSTTGRTTRNHGFLVFDTLYGLDERLNPQPQMALGHIIEDSGKRWTLTLRDQLRREGVQP